jgi:hypothetical protein
MLNKNSSIFELLIIPLISVIFIWGSFLATESVYETWKIWFNAQSWQEVPCTIESNEVYSKIEERSSRRSRTRKVKIFRIRAEYLYSFNGRPFVGNRVHLTDLGYRDSESHEQLSSELDKYRVSRESHRCFVNPDNPHESVLFREADSITFFVLSLFLSVFWLSLLVLNVGYFWAVKLLWRARRAKRIHPGEPWRWELYWEGDKLFAKNEKWLFTWVITTLILAILWLPVVYAATVEQVIFKSWVTGVLIYGQLALWLLVAHTALRHLRDRLQGRIFLQIKSDFVASGRVLQGSFTLPSGLIEQRFESVSLELRCVSWRKNPVGPGLDIAKVWSENQKVPRCEIIRGVQNCSLPFEISIPEGLPVSPEGEGLSKNKNAMRYVWELELRIPECRRLLVFEIPMPFRRSVVI